MTNEATERLKARHQDAGNVVTVEDSVPGDLTSYDQVWDIRFSNNQPISAGERAKFLNFLQGGGGMFVVGENRNFMDRNNSVLSLIDAVGGGTLNFVTPLKIQILQDPFYKKNQQTSISFLAAGGVDGSGTGQFMTKNGTSGSAVVWQKGTLKNVPLGVLAVVFDINFLQGLGYGSDVILPKLIDFVGGTVPIPHPVPIPATLPLLGGALLALATLRRRRRVSAD